MMSAHRKVASEIGCATSVRDEITAYFAKVAPGSVCQNLTPETPLLGSGLLDSLSILQLTMFLSDRWGIEISDEDFTPENFATIGSLVALVEGKLGESP